MKVLIHFFIAIQLLMVSLTQAQSLLKGKIVSASSGEPLGGATVSIRNASSGTASGKEGAFSITVPPGASGKDGKTTIRISLIGYRVKDTVLLIPSPSPVLIPLVPLVSSLEEVTVSTGYQRLPRERATGSFTHIGGERLSEQISTDIISKLEPVASGLIFDRGTTSSPRIMVRGLNTLTAGMMEPLIVLDNFPYDGDLNNINPNDVADISILKDAAASSIWGSKAANGVIVITTKKAAANQKTSLDFSANATVGAKPDLFYLRQMSSSDFIDAEQFLYSKGYYNSQISSASKPVLSPVVELLIKRDAAGPAEAAEIDSQIDALRGIDVRNDFDRYLYQHALNQQYYLNLKGGSPLTGYSLSAGADRNINTLNAAYNRLNLRILNTFTPFKSASLNTGIYYTQSKSASGRQGYESIRSKGSSLYPYMQMADENGNPLPVPRDWRFSYIEDIGDKLEDWRYYPLEEYQYLDNSTNLSDLVASASFGYRHPKGLKAELSYQYERQQTNNRNYSGAESYFTRNLVNSYAQQNAPGGVDYKIPQGAIVDYSDELMQSHQVRGQLGFEHNGYNHALSVIAGGEIRQSNGVSHASRVYGFDPNTLTSGTVDFTTQYPNFITGSRAFIPNMDFATDRLTRFISLYTNAAFTLANRYTASFSARRDASNLFGFQTNDRWNPLWSAGGAWELSRESFYRSGLVPFLKIRFSYGEGGNIHPSMASATTIRYFGNSAYTQSPYARFDNYANPDLKWETTRMLNTALDFRLINQRLSGSVEYYRKKSRDLFAAVPIDYTSGIGITATKNYASIRGNGLDVSLQSVNLNGKIKWTTDLNYSRNEDEVTEYYLASERASNFLTVIPSRTGVKGKPVYSLFSYRWAGLDPQNGTPRGYFNDEISNNYSSLTGTQVTVSDLNFHGSAIPTVFGSMGNTFSWKRYSVTARITWKLNYFFRKETISYSGLYSNWVGNSDYARRWKQPGDEEHTDIPAMIYPASTSMENFYKFAEPFVLPGDHVRLQYLNFAWRPGNRLLKGLRVKDLQVSLNVANLGLIWKKNKEGLDPDYSYNASMLPPSRTYSLGLKTTL